jgi:hypothetical protein
MIFKALVCLCFAALSLAVIGVAAAAQPHITDINRELESLGPDPFLSGTCGFDVEVLNEARIRIVEFSNGTAQSHHHETYYWQANGRSLTEHVNFTIVFGPDESMGFHGAVFNLHVPGVGVAVVDVGHVIMSRDGIIHQAGLHQILGGTSNPMAVCDYLDGS